MPIEQHQSETADTNGETRVLLRGVSAFDRSQVAPIDGTSQAPLGPPCDPPTGDSHGHLIDPMLALPSYRTSSLFSDLDKLVLDFAVGMSRTPVVVSDTLFDELRTHFDDAQLVELTHHIALENMRGRFNLALGVGSAGFSEGMVCAMPDIAGVGG
jgi:hypothetical protein